LYAQGISTAAIGAEMLEETLSEGLHGLGLRYFAKLAPHLEHPWKATLGEDLRYPQFASLRSRITPLLQWYTLNLHRVSGQDLRVLTEFLAVAHFMKSASALFQPWVVSRVLRCGLGLLPLGPERERYRRLQPGEGLIRKIRASGGQRKFLGMP
jgi:hypothetical protein